MNVRNERDSVSSTTFLNDVLLLYLNLIANGVFNTVANKAQVLSLQAAPQACTLGNVHPGASLR